MYKLSISSGEEVLKKLSRGFEENLISSDTTELTFSAETREKYFEFADKISIYLAKAIKENFGRKIINHELKKFEGLKKEHKEIIKTSLFTKNDGADTEIIKEEIFEYLKSSDKISLFGFAMFRLGRYRDFLKEKIKNMADNIRVDEQCEDFTNLLKTYVDMKPPTINVMHVCVSVGGGYTIFDGNGNDITEDCIKDVMPLFEMGDIYMDDLLLSILISVSPRIIYIHNPGFFKEKNFFETIKSIFRTRIRECHGECN